MRVCIDEQSLQARAHRHDGGLRLKDLLRLLEGDVGASVSFAGAEGLTGIDARPDVLMILTRPEPYDPAEIDWVVEFVRDGGGLLLLANHGDLPGRNPNDHASNDAVLAARLGASIETAWFQLPPDPPRLLSIGGEWIDDHEITAGITEVVINNGTSVLTSDVRPLVRVPMECVDLRDGRDPRGRAFFVALDGGEGLPDGYRGRAVIGGDSGFVGGRRSIWPGPGLLDLGDNAPLLRNMILWLSSR